MERSTSRRYTITLIFFVSVSFILAQLGSFFTGVYSDHPLFAKMNGNVEWWMYIVSYLIQVVLLFAFVIFVGLSKERMTMKQALMIGVYCFGLYKDIYDWCANAQGTKYQDWIITIALLAAVQFLYDHTRKILGK